MSLRITLATAGRVLAQLRRDHRTLALLLVMPMLLLSLLRWMYEAARPRSTGSARPCLASCRSR